MTHSTLNRLYEKYYHASSSTARAELARDIEGAKRALAEVIVFSFTAISRAAWSMQNGKDYINACGGRETLSMVYVGNCYTVEVPVSYLQRYPLLLDRVSGIRDYVARPDQYRASAS